MADPIKSPMYGTLLVDEKGAALINYFLQIAQDEPNLESMRNFCKHYDIQKEDFAKFINSYSKMEHDMGWCKDPFCKYWEKNKKPE